MEAIHRRCAIQPDQAIPPMRRRGVLAETRARAVTVQRPKPLDGSEQLLGDSGRTLGEALPRVFDDGKHESSCGRG